ncbi:DUF2225 domain-containing protein [Oligoflexus tunisiensis]|uniref:DUF2225 domain-containing protein n=1 Tax=Oligoflexus tunisiensis TaxID=708132 RepID=UPI00114CB0D0|nr:DUF2225 domain-containing protein [Oligoflexus tunisiensis]
MSPSQDAGISPFQTMQARCVICEKDGRFSRLKSTLYSETKRDIDLRPVTVLWSKKVAPRVDPKLFYFWQCPYCFFTADHIFFLQPFKDGNLSTTRFRKQYQKGQAAYTTSQSIQQLLISDPKENQSVFINGLKLNLLACFQWEQVEEVVNGECLQLASYYLRLGWLLHDLRHGLTKSPSVKEEAQALISALRPLWPSFAPGEPATLEKALKYYQLALTKSAAVNTILQEVNVRLIITRIHMKLSRLGEAKKSIVECKSRVKYYESLIKKKRGDDSHFASSDLQDMETAHGKCLALLSQVELIYDKIELTIIERQVKTAQDLLNQHADKSYEEKVQILRQARYSDKVIAKVLPKEKKKGLFDILKSG